MHRVLKPGGHMVAFGGTRTWHRLATAAEDSGLEIRDTIAWIHGTGRPKTTDLARTAGDLSDGHLAAVRGLSTTLSPVFEPAILARKPLDGTVIDTVLQHGTGALNIDACRTPVAGGEGRWPSNGVLDPHMLRALDDRFERSLFPALRVAKPTQKERVCVDGVYIPLIEARLARRLEPARMRPARADELTLPL